MKTEIDIRSTNSKEVMDLYAAVKKYVESKSGKVVMISGIKIGHQPNEDEKFMVCVECVGVRPIFNATHRVN